jgi:hypothetical protein
MLNQKEQKVIDLGFDRNQFRIAAQLAPAGVKHEIGKMKSHPSVLDRLPCELRRQGLQLVFGTPRRVGAVSG